MDPFTMMAIAGAAPGILSLFQGQPSMPQPSFTNNIPLPQNMGGYTNQLFQDAFNPNSNLLSIALDKSNGGLMRMLASQGLGNSSYADRAISANDNDITNQWIQNATSRESGAMNALSGMIGSQVGLGQAQYTDAFQNYLQSLKNSGSFDQGIGTIAGGVMGPLAMGSLYNQNQNNFNTLMDSFGGRSGSGYVSPSNPLSTMSVTHG